MTQDKVVTAVRIRSSVYLFGNYELPTAVEPGQITRDFFTLVVKTSESAYNLVLSFKHICRVDFLDNREKKGAGIILFLNKFMSEKLQASLQLDSNAFLNYRLVNAPQASFIVLDVLNSEQENIAAIHQVLNLSAKFHADYVKMRLQESGKDLPMFPNYINVIRFDEWRKHLAYLHKDFIVEEVTMRDARDQEVQYCCGHIANIVPLEKLERAKHQRLFNMGQLNEPIYKKSRKARNVTEVNLADDDEEGHSSQNNGVVVVYNPAPEFNCTLYESDVQTLNNTIMLNDSIIDFYLHYIYYELLPKEIRERVFLFNSFFYTKLCKGVVLHPNNRLPKQRPRKLQENYNSLKSWTKGVNLFNKDYIVVPINEEAHWYLAVIVNPQAGIVQKEDTTPGHISVQRVGANCLPIPSIPIFIFDSLIDAQDMKRHQNVVDFLAHYMSMEYKEKKEELTLPGCGYRQHTFQLHIPKGMPQQKNHYDCGIFMLMFAEVFLKRTLKPGDFTKDSTFLDLFEWPTLRGKREEIKNIVKTLQNPKEEPTTEPMDDKNIEPEAESRSDLAGNGGQCASQTA